MIDRGQLVHVVTPGSYAQTDADLLKAGGIACLGRLLEAGITGKVRARRPRL